MKPLGVTLIAAALVIAHVLTASFWRLLVLARAIDASCGQVGMYLSYHLDISSGATTVLVGFVLLAVIYAVTGVRGLRRVAALADHRPATVAGSRLRAVPIAAPAETRPP